MRRAFAALMCVGLGSCSLHSCQDVVKRDEGYVEIRIIGDPAGDLYLGGDRIDIKKRVVFLKLPSGEVGLSNTSWWILGPTPYCRLDVRPYRSTKLTINFQGEDASCQCDIRKPNGGSKPTCI